MSCVVHTLVAMAEVEGATVVGTAHLAVPHGEIRALVVRDAAGRMRAVYWDRATRTMVAPEVDAVAELGEWAPAAPPASSV